MWYWGALLSKVGKLTLKEDGFTLITGQIKLTTLPDKKAKAITFDLGFCKDDPHPVYRDVDSAYLVIENEFYHFSGMQSVSYINDSGRICLRYLYQHCTCGEIN